VQAALPSPALPRKTTQGPPSRRVRSAPRSARRRAPAASAWPGRCAGTRAAATSSLACPAPLRPPSPAVRSTSWPKGGPARTTQSAPAATPRVSLSASGMRQGAPGRPGVGVDVLHDKVRPAVRSGFPVAGRRALHRQQRASGPCRAVASWQARSVRPEVSLYTRRLSALADSSPRCPPSQTPPCGWPKLAAAATTEALAAECPAAIQRNTLFGDVPLSFMDGNRSERRAYRRRPAWPAKTQPTAGAQQCMR
jgi:hypothetical protein